MTSTEVYSSFIDAANDLLTNIPESLSERPGIAGLDSYTRDIYRRAHEVIDSSDRYTDRELGMAYGVLHGRDGGYGEDGVMIQIRHEFKRRAIEDAGEFIELKLEDDSRRTIMNQHISSSFKSLSDTSKLLELYRRIRDELGDPKPSIRMVPPPSPEIMEGIRMTYTHYWYVGLLVLIDETLMNAGQYNGIYRTTFKDIVIFGEPMGHRPCY